MIIISDVIIAVGDSYTNVGHKKAELLRVNDNSWTEIESYPFVMGINKFNH